MQGAYDICNWVIDHQIVRKYDQEEGEWKKGQIWPWPWFITTMAFGKIAIIVQSFSINHRRTTL